MAALLSAVSARADAVHLRSGRVIEGQVTADGDKVVIATESGRISVPRGDVARIAQGEPPLVEAQRREAALTPHDRAGLLQLADFCREHGLGARERALLERLVALDPDHAEARRRLGYVRGPKGWVARGDRAREDAMLRRERERADLEIRHKRAEVALTEAKLAREREPAAPAKPEAPEAPAQPPAPVIVGPYYPLYPWHGAHRAPLLPPAMPPPHVSEPPFPINGVRSPQSYFDEMRGVRR
ncbi:MAG: hypothetical protein ABW252_05115 [Polyangiales bacterium]